MSQRGLKDGRPAVAAGEVQGSSGRAVGVHRLWSRAGDDSGWRMAVAITPARQTAHSCGAVSAAPRNVAIDVEVGSRCLYR
jgi:hypothetical protein